MSRLIRSGTPGSQLKSEYFPFEGGINLVDPAQSIPPGELVAADNFEVDLRGRYRRIDGYERYDGQTLPSKIEPYYRIPFTIGSVKYPTFTSAYSTAFFRNVPSSGDMVKGATTGATGTVLVVVMEAVTGGSASGSFAADDGQGYIYFTVTSGTLQDGEKLYFLNKDSAFGGEFDVEFT
jgi:hypothetical protein|tara:strand:- start:272 stop:808 length:537 start_codon:yes stop_codon:yes gene_type:complete